MPDSLLKCPSRGRLFKLFTDIGPYFRKLKSNESSFFFDCLEICVDADAEPEDRTFLGWTLLVTHSENMFEYERANGLYDIEGNWVNANITKKEMDQINQSFLFFIKKLRAIIDKETGCELKAH